MPPPPLPATIGCPWRAMPCRASAPAGPRSRSTPLLQMRTPMAWPGGPGRTAARRRRRPERRYPKPNLYRPRQYGIRAACPPTSRARAVRWRPTAWGSDVIPVSVLPANTFTDVLTGHWAFSYIWACTHAGIVGGYSDGTYRPANPVNRGQMAVFIARALSGGEAYVPTGPPVTGPSSTWSMPRPTAS